MGNCNNLSLATTAILIDKMLIHLTTRRADMSFLLVVLGTPWHNPFYIITLVTVQPVPAAQVH